MTLVGMLSVDVVPVGGGGGATTPGQSISPAGTVRASASVRIVAAHVRRKVFFM